MKYPRIARLAKFLIPGFVLLQATGCAFYLELFQTAFLAVTAAGAVAILENI